MTRKITLCLVGLIAVGTLLLVAGPSQSAEAQCTVSYNGVIVNSTGCLAYTPFTPTATPIPRPTAAPTSAAVVSADTVTATAGSSSTTPAIAFTGSESQILGYAGAGLIAAGAGALVLARRRYEAEEELD